jgi:hypothetical protein
MVDGYVSWEDTVDPSGCNTDPINYLWASRDPQRTPFQWNAEKNAGMLLKSLFIFRLNYKKVNNKDSAKYQSMLWVSRFGDFWYRIRIA